MQTRAAADAIHDSTKHGTPPVEPERLVQYRRLDPDNAPEPFKRYRNRPISPLPRALVSSTHPAVAVLSGARGDSKPLDVSLLATLLYLTAGVTRTTEASARRKIYFRAAMSAGNLHPVEVYVVAGPGIAGVPVGVHHFAPLEFGLTELRSGDFRGSLSLSAPVALIFTGLVWRTTWKYGERGWRHLYWDTGAMLANLLSAAEAHGVDAHVFAGFADQTVNDLLGIDGVDEVPIAVVALGSQAGTKADPIPNLAPLHLEVVQVAPNPIRLPLVVDAQAGSALTIDDTHKEVQFNTTEHGIRYPMSSMPGEPVDHVFAGPMADETIHFVEAVVYDRPVMVKPDEARLVMDSIKHNVEAAGMNMDDLVSVQIYCSDVTHYQKFNDVYKTYFTKQYPARAFIGAGTLLFNARFEVVATAVRR